jgi:hypothetical protein
MMAGVSLQNVDAADNIDLLNVLQEWEDFYEIRFQRRPKLTRKVFACMCVRANACAHPNAPSAPCTSRTHTHQRLSDQVSGAAEQGKLPTLNKVASSSARRRPSPTTSRGDSDAASDASTRPPSASGKTSHAISACIHCSRHSHAPRLPSHSNPSHSCPSHN